MKPRSWALVIVMGAWCGPAWVWAQGIQSGPPLPMPQTSVNRPAGTGSFLPDIDSSALPNRRVPVPAPPGVGEVRPVTPEAWRRAAPSKKEVRPSKKSDTDNTIDGKALSGKGESGIKEPLQRLRGADRSAPTQRLTDDAAGKGIQSLPSTGGKSGSGR